MKLPRRNFLHLAAGAVALPAVSRVAWAQAYPSRPVRLIVGAPAEGGFDIVARLMGQWLSERLGQQFVIENRPGAGSNIATEAVVRALPDGYTLLLVTSVNVINATLYDNLKYNFVHDIAPVAGITRVPEVMVVNPSVPANTVSVRSSSSFSLFPYRERKKTRNNYLFLFIFLIGSGPYPPGGPGAGPVGVSVSSCLLALLV
jgi:hypothetical protein